MKEAVVLLNMGGPSSLREVDMFLKNMFNDPRILPIKSPILRAFAASFIANSRSEVAKSNYRQIGGKSPLISHMFNLVQKLQGLDSSRFYTYAMRYTPPCADMTVRELKQKGIEKITLFSLYPQYSTTTTLSSIEDFKAQCARQDYAPEICEVDRYFDDKAYNKAVIERILEGLDGENPSDYTLIFSAHSLPKRVIDAGDPYEKEVHENIKHIVDSLQESGVHFAKITHAYQSKVGPIKWLKPSLEQVLREHERERILIYPIAFTLDNSETDFELRIEYKKRASELGVESYKVARCLNDSSLFAHAIINLVSKGEK